MKIKNSIILVFFLFCVYCITYLYVNPSARAQYQATNYNNYNNYYEYTDSTLFPSYQYNNVYSNNYSWSNMYPNNYSLSDNQYLRRDITIPTLKINDWTVQPAFGNTVYALSSNGNALTIYGTYFSAHTQAGVNFDRTLFMGNTSYPATNRSIYQNSGMQSSYISPLSYYARQVLQFSPVLHGPLLNY